MASQIRVTNPDYGCNGCDSTGIEVKWPTQWRRHDGDITLRGLLDDDSDKPFTLIGGGKAYTKDTWNGDDFVDTSGELDAAWAALSPDTRLVVVDCHN